MIQDLKDFLPEFRRHHGMYVMRKTYAGTCAFMTGYEVGAQRPCLKRFHEFLVPRGKGRPELYWPLLVLCEIYPDGSLPDIRCLTPDQDEQANAMLFRLLDGFFSSLDGD